MRIHSETTQQQGSDYVYALVNGKRAYPSLTPIGDSAAVTIAAWWQSPGTVGKAFAELASTGSVELDDLMRDIELTFPEADNDADRMCLVALFAWATYKAMEV